MFAIVEDGSRQYRVQEGDTLTIDYRAESSTGDALLFDRVLLANGGAESLIGRPVIDGAVVEAEIVEPIALGPKLEVAKFRKRKNSRRHTGHRQKHTTVHVTAIKVPGLKVVQSSETPQSGETTETGADAS